MKLKPITFEQALAMVEAGYHCEVRTADDCAYRPAPHFVGSQWSCDACLPDAEAEATELEPVAPSEHGHRYNFPKLDVDEP